MIVWNRLLDVNSKEDEDRDCPLFFFTKKEVCDGSGDGFEWSCWLADRLFTGRDSGWPDYFCSNGGFYGVLVLEELRR